jgi:hypothetical protein
MVSARVKNGVPQGQILKLKEPYRLVSEMNVLEKCFPDQLEFDTMTSFDDAMT